MKKVKLLLIALFLTSSLCGQEIRVFGSLENSDVGEEDSFMISENVSLGLYFVNSDKIEFQSILLNVGDRGIGKSFVIRVLSAPVMKNGKMYKNNDNFRSICRSNIICLADRKGVIELDVSNKNITTNGNFILKFEKLDDDSDPTIVEEDKMSDDGRSIDGKKNQSYYGASICTYNKQFDDIFQLMYLKRSNTFTIFRNKRDFAQGVAVKYLVEN